MVTTTAIKVSNNVIKLLNSKRKYPRETWNDILEEELGLSPKKHKTERRLKK